MAREVNKLQLLSRGDQDPHIQQLLKNYTELANSHNNLVTAFNKNFSIWNGVIANLDTRVGALSLALQEVLVKQQFPPLDHYVLEYQKLVAAESLKIQEAQAALGASAAEFQDGVPLAPPDPLITPPAAEVPEDEDEVDSDFGGDLEHAQT